MEPPQVLQVIRLLVDKELSFKPENQFIKSDYFKHVRPLVICLEEYLREKGYSDKDERREIRLYIYEAIVRRPIGTTYDLSAYQCRTITNFLEEFVSFTLTDEGEELLEFLTSQFEAGAAPYPSRETELQERTTEAVASMPDLPF